MSIIVSNLYCFEENEETFRFFYIIDDKICDIKDGKLIPTNLHYSNLFTPGIIKIRSFVVDLTGSQPILLTRIGRTIGLFVEIVQQIGDHLVEIHGHRASGELISIEELPIPTISLKLIDEALLKPLRDQVATTLI